MICPETDFLVNYFKALNEADVKYALTRNTDTLPESLGGSDLDLLALDDAEAKKAFNIACSIARKYGGRCVNYYKVEVIVASFGGQKENGEWWGCHIDIIPGVKYYGIPYMDAAVVLSERKLVRDSFYCCGPIAHISTFLKEILRNHKTRKDYYPVACNAFKENAEGIRGSMIYLIGSHGCKLIDELLSETRTDVFVCKQSYRITRWIWLYYIIRFRWLTLLRVKSINYFNRIRRLFFKPGIAVAFLGTDGSGKSTLIENIKEPLERMLHSKIHYEHLRPNLLPYLAQLKGQKPTGKPCTDPHGGKVAGRLSSLIRFSYYYLDYIFGYWLKIYPILVKRPSMVFFDRYYYEYIIDPRRCAVKLPRGWAKFWGWFIPKPDLILCLGGDPAKIYARKPETSLEEVTRQVRALKEFCFNISKHPNIQTSKPQKVWIDTTLSIEESKNAALTAITTFMSKSQK